MTLKPSLRVQWILSFAVGAIVIAALVVVVDRSGNPSAPAPPLNKNVVETENREAEILVSQDQAPHVVRLAHRMTAAAALTAALSVYMSQQISHGSIDGPIERSSCSPRGGTSARQLFSCTVEAADVNYPFAGVVAPAARLVTFCKRDYAPVASMNIPLSRRCT